MNKEINYLSDDGIIMTVDNFSEIMKNMKTQDRLFMNSECMLVEYYDILKCPWYVLLTVLGQNEKVRPILDIDKISFLDSNSQFEWYCNRKNRNFLLDIALAPTDKVDYDQILDILMNNKIFYDIDSSLNAKDAIDIALRQKQVKELIIYSEKNDPLIKEDINRIFSKYKNVKFRCGDFDTVAKTLPRDTSYMLSDFNKVVTLSECDKLNYSSIILPFDFGYNYITDDDGKKVPIIDFEYLGKDHLFKLNYFNACYQ